MDPNSSLGKICLGENVVEISSDKIEGSGDWNFLEFQDTANSGGKKETKAMVFHQMDIEEVSDRFVAPCFVNGLEAYDGEINLGVEENMISNKYEVKLCLEHEKDNVELDGKIIKEEKEAVKRIKGEALKEKDDPGEFLFPIRLEGKVNENAFADTGSDINTMHYRIYEQLGREEMKKVDRGIIMINHTQAEAMGILTNVLCQVGVTTLIAKFLILDIPIDCDALIVVTRGFLRMIDGIVNTPERLFSTFDGFCHQTFRAARSNVMRNTESDSDDEEEYQIKRNTFGSPIYGPKPAAYLNCNDPAERSLAIQTTMGTHDDEVGSSRSKRSRQHETVEEGTHDYEAGSSISKRSRQHETVKRYCFHKFTMSYFYGKDATDMRKFCHEFYSTYEFDEVYANDELQTKKIIKFRLGGRAHNLTLSEFSHRLGLYHADDDLQIWVLMFTLEGDTTTLRDLIDSEGKLIPEDPQLG
ncbi:putative reverse transcriptase, RNA-dependent DNA polymerase [Tanacetum coccineum]